MIYEAPRDTSRPLKVRGVGRDAGEPRALLVMLTERPTDDDIRSLHEFLRGWKSPTDRWKHCPSTHCERRQECASPHECCAAVSKREAHN